MVSFLTLKSPFCKYEVAKDQDDTEDNNESDEKKTSESIVLLEKKIINIRVYSPRLLLLMS